MKCHECGSGEFYATETIIHGFDVTPEDDVFRPVKQNGVDWNRATFEGDYRVYCSGCGIRVENAEVEVP